MVNIANRRRAVYNSPYIKNAGHYAAAPGKAIRMNGFYTEGNTLYLNDTSEIILQKCLVTESVALHKHRFIEIAYVDAGSGIHEIAGGLLSQIEKGDLMLFNAEVAHEYRVTPPGSLTVYNCLFDPSVIDASVSESDDFIRIVYDYLFEPAAHEPGQPPYIVLRHAESVADIIKEMHREYVSGQSGAAKMNAANLTRLLITIFRLKRSGKADNVAAYKQAIAESAKRYIETYYAGNISCDALAARAFVSTGYFHRIFKEVTGMTPVAYAQRVRLTEAARLLRETALSVRAAAEAVGYSDLKYFYSLFYKAFGTTPDKYRKTC